LSLDFGFESKFLNNAPLAIGIGLVVAVVGGYMLSKVEKKPAKNSEKKFDNVEGVFAILMIFTASAMAFAHGSNDVANAVGPLAAKISVTSMDLNSWWYWYCYWFSYLWCTSNENHW